MKLAVAIALPVAVGLLAGPAPASLPAGGVEVTSDRTEVAATLGDRFSFTTTVRNDTGSATEPLVASLNVVSLADGVYVDPEDWSGNRTRYLGKLAAATTKAIAWHVQAVTSGDVAVYVTVLPQDGAGSRPSTSRVIRVTVAKRSTIDPGGALALVLGIPAILGLLAATARLARRRTA